MKRLALLFTLTLTLSFPMDDGGGGEAICFHHNGQLWCCTNAGCGTRP